MVSRRPAKSSTEGSALARRRWFGKYWRRWNAAMNISQHTVIQITARLLSVLGIFVYGLFLYLWSIEWRQNTEIHLTVGSEVKFILSDVIFASGLPPLLLTIYFLLLGKTKQELGVGIMAVVISIPVHFVVTVFAAHSDAWFYLPMQLAELLAALALIFYWHRHWRGKTSNLKAE